MLKVNSYAGNNFVNASAPLAHPMADEISIAMGDSAMGRFPYSVEIAFFKNEEWVTEILAEFAPYTDREDAGTRVYAYVPLTLVSQFIDNWSKKN